jgi:hypothetical protein
MMELEALCKRLEEDAQTLKEEKATLEGMVESHNKLIMEITKKTGLDRMGEDAIRYGRPYRRGLDQEDWT